MFATVLQAILLGLLAFTAGHYTTVTLFNNSKVAIVFAAVFAVLVVLFAGRLVL